MSFRYSKKNYMPVLRDAFGGYYTLIPGRYSQEMLKQIYEKQQLTPKEVKNKQYEAE